jgi:hypothetical protein
MTIPPVGALMHEPQLPRLEGEQLRLELGDGKPRHTVEEMRERVIRAVADSYLRLRSRRRK